MANPTLRDNFIKDSFSSLSEDYVMTQNGTILKTLFLSGLMVVTFVYSWYLQVIGFVDKAMMLYKVGLFGGLGLCLAICFLPKNRWLMITTSLYALCEGLVLGAFSYLANKFYPGVVSQAAIGTLSVLVGMLFLFTFNVIKCTDKFRSIISCSLFGIFGIYLVQMILNFFNLQIPAIFSNSPIGIGFSVIVVAIASFSLIVDFDNISKFAGRADKYYEWYFGFSLLVTVIWLYIEMLNLLMKLQSRD